MPESTVDYLWLGLSYLLQGIGLFAVATFLFDIIHFLLHCFMKSRWSWLRRIGDLHRAHHEFLTEDLRFQESVTRRNLLLHVVPEFSTQMLVCSLGFLVLDPIPVVVVMAMFSVIFVFVIIQKGKDANHVAAEKLLSAHETIFVMAPYHSLHHIHPENYFASYTTLIDRILGTACQIRGRKFAMTGASGAFGSPFKRMLEHAGAANVATFKFGEDFTYENYADLDEELAAADVLVLSHGSKLDHAMEANCDSFLAIIERFKELHKDDRFPTEVWAVGSEIECHPAFGNKNLQVYLESKRAYARHARRYYRDRAILYRHIVPSAFTSRMGPGLISGTMAARIALFFIRRGFRYVPVTYTGIAFVNYFKFLFPINIARKGDEVTR